MPSTTWSTLARQTLEVLRSSVFCQPPPASSKEGANPFGSCKSQLARRHELGRKVSLGFPALMSAKEHLSIDLRSVKVETSEEGVFCLNPPRPPPLRTQARSWIGLYSWKSNQTSSWIKVPPCNSNKKRRKPPHGPGVRLNTEELGSMGLQCC